MVFKVICAWCQKWISGPFCAEWISHGLCRQCMAQQLAELRGEDVWDLWQDIGGGEG